jgi:hypothetical protein
LNRADKEAQELEDVVSFLLLQTVQPILLSSKDDLNVRQATGGVSLKQFRRHRTLFTRGDRDSEHLRILFFAILGLQILNEGIQTLFGLFLNEFVGFLALLASVVSVPVMDSNMNILILLTKRNLRQVAAKSLRPGVKAANVFSHVCQTEGGLWTNVKMWSARLFILVNTKKNQRETHHLKHSTGFDDP